MIFEIKRSINNNLAMVSLQDLTQTLMECRYCMQQYDTTQIVGCLSDASTWHFMNCSVPAPSVDALITVDGALTVAITNDDYNILTHSIARMLIKMIEVQFIVHSVLYSRKSVPCV